MARLRKLVANRRFRLESGLMVIDGPVLLSEALSAGIEIRDVYHDVTIPLRPSLARELADRDVAVHAVAPGVVGHVADPVSPRPVITVAARPDTSSLDQLTTLVLVDLANPGNVGALVRCAEAMGITQVLAAGRVADPYGPKAIRASAGSVLRVRICELSSGANALGRVIRMGLRIVATATEAHSRAVPVDEADLTGAVALLLGSEARGLPDDLLDAADTVVTVPMAGQIESLGVAGAGAIVTYELARQRRGGAGSSPTAS